MLLKNEMIAAVTLALLAGCAGSSPPRIPEYQQHVEIKRRHTIFQ